MIVLVPSCDPSWCRRHCQLGCLFAPIVRLGSGIIHRGGHNVHPCTCQEAGCAWASALPPRRHRRQFYVKCGPFKFWRLGLRLWLLLLVHSVSPLPWEHLKVCCLVTSTPTKALPKSLHQDVFGLDRLLIRGFVKWDAIRVICDIVLGALLPHNLFNSDNIQNWINSFTRISRLSHLLPLLGNVMVTSALSDLLSLLIVLRLTKTACLEISQMGRLLLIHHIVLYFLFILYMCYT